MSICTYRALGPGLLGLLAAPFLVAPAGAVPMLVPFRDLDVGSLVYEASINGAGCGRAVGEVSAAGNFSIPVACSSGTVNFSGEYVARIEAGGSVLIGVRDVTFDPGDVSGISSYFFTIESIAADDPAGSPSWLFDVPVTPASDTTTIVVDASGVSVLGYLFANDLHVCLPERQAALFGVGCRQSDLGFPELFGSEATMQFFPAVGSEIRSSAGQLTLREGLVSYTATALVTNPEPSTAFLLGLGLAGLARRRNGTPPPTRREF